MSTTAAPDRFGQRDFVVGAQKLVPTLAAAHQRIYTRSLPLEDARAPAVYGQHSQVGKNPRDSSGIARPHPHRPYPPASRLLSRRATRIAPR